MLECRAHSFPCLPHFLLDMSAPPLRAGARQGARGGGISGKGAAQGKNPAAASLGHLSLSLARTHTKATAVDFWNIKCPLQCAPPHHLEAVADPPFPRSGSRGAAFRSGSPAASRKSKSRGSESSLGARSTRSRTTSGSGASSGESSSRRRRRASPPARRWPPRPLRQPTGARGGRTDRVLAGRLSGSRSADCADRSFCMAVGFQSE